MTATPGLSSAELQTWRTFLRAHATVTRRLEAELVAEQGLPLASYDVLVQLSEAPDRSLRMTELADRVLLSRSGLTRLADRLERDGLLRREACPSDARGTLAVLTDAGLQRLEQAWPTHRAGRRRARHRPAERRRGRGARAAARQARPGRAAARGRLRRPALTPSRERSRVVRDGWALGFAVGLYGTTFGAAAVTAGLSAPQACVLSALMFTGASQFALVGVLGAGGSAVSAVAGALLLGVRNTLYAVRVSSLLPERGLRRAVAAHLTIDESTARRPPRRQGSSGPASGRRASASSSSGTPSRCWARWAPPGSATRPTSASTRSCPRRSWRCSGRSSPAAGGVATAVAGALVAVVALPLLPAGVPVLLAGLVVLPQLLRRTA